MTRFIRRTRLFIARKFQIRYIAAILFFMFLTAVLTGYTVYVTSCLALGEKMALVYPQGLLAEIFKKVNMVLFLRMLFLIPLVTLVALVLSSRIAGPIYSIQRFLRKISCGNYKERLKLREKDELKDLAELLNHLVSRLHSGETSRREKIHLALAEAAELEKVLETDNHNHGDLSGRIHRIKELLGSLKYL